MATYWVSFGHVHVCTGIVIVEAKSSTRALSQAVGLGLTPDHPVSCWRLRAGKDAVGLRLLGLLPRDTLMTRDEVDELERIARRRPG